MTDKVIWVSEDIQHSLSGWYIVAYQINENGGDFFQHKMFDTKKAAKQFIAECKKEIKENDKKSN